MRKLLLLVATLAACGGTSSQFRNPSGMPVPTFAAIDSPYQKIELHCGADRYFLVDDAQSGQGGRMMRTLPRNLALIDPDRICQNIAAYGR
jgi:hypothetical protein